MIFLSIFIILYILPGILVVILALRDAKVSGRGMRLSDFLLIIAVAAVPYIAIHILYEMLLKEKVSNLLDKLILWFDKILDKPVVKPKGDTK